MLACAAMPLQHEYTAAPAPELEAPRTPLLLCFYIGQLAALKSHFYSVLLPNEPLISVGSVGLVTASLVEAWIYLADLALSRSRSCCVW